MLINDFRQIVTTVQNDITAMNNKRSLQSRGVDCLQGAELDDATLRECVEGSDSADVLGRKTRRQNQEPYSEAEQFAVCNSFGDVSTLSFFDFDFGANSESSSASTSSS